MKQLLLLVIALVCCSAAAFPYGAGAGGGRIKIAKEELIPAEFILNNVGKVDIDVIYRNGRGYLPVIAIFNFLEIKAELASDGNSVIGTYPTADKKFSIEFFTGKVKTADTSAVLGTDDYTFSDAELFLREDLFKPFFGMDLQYSSKRLVVTIRSNPNLPVFQARARQLRRQGLLQRSTPVQPEYYMGLNRSVLELGKVNWLFTSRVSEVAKPLTLYSLQGGGKIALGDFNASVRSYFGRKLNENNVHGNLRYVFESPALRQITLGDLSTVAVNSRSLLGVEVTNRPPARRLLFDNQNVHAYAGAGDELEFYYNGALQSYVNAAADTMIDYTVPLRYGLSEYTYKTYSRFNEIDETRLRSLVPYSMIPRGEVQYSIIAGKIRGYNYRNASASVSRGFTNALTLGAGVDMYEKGFAGRRAYPYITGGARFLSSLTGTMLISPLATSRFDLDYQMPNQVHLTGSYLSYSHDVTLNQADLISSVIVGLVAPFNVSMFNFGVGVIGEDDIGVQNHSRSLTASASGRYQGFALTGSHRVYQYAVGGAYQTIQQSTDVNASLRSAGEIIFRGAFSYDHVMERPYSLNLGIEKLFFNKLDVELGYSRIFTPSASSANLRLYYQLPFATFSSRTERDLASSNDRPFVFNNSLSGSVFMSTRTGDFLALPTQRGNYGAILVRPFVDGNDNGIPDAGEEYLPKTVVTSRSQLIAAMTRPTAKGTLMPNSEPYQSYILGFDRRTAFDNPHLVSRYQAIQVTAEPNTLKLVNMPITVGGMVRGSIKIAGQRSAVLENVGGVTLILKKVSSLGSAAAFSKKTKSFTNGEFEFSGVPPGSYEITLDASDLLKLGAVAKTPVKQITIQAKAEGDQVEGVDFELQ